MHYQALPNVIRPTPSTKTGYIHTQHNIAYWVTASAMQTDRSEPANE